jgi:hypothetical protein
MVKQPANLEPGASKSRKRRFSDPATVKKHLDAENESLRAKIHKLMIAHTDKIVDFEETARKDGLERRLLRKLFSGPAGMTARVAHDLANDYLETFMDDGYESEDSSDAETIEHVPGCGSVANDAGSEHDGQSVGCGNEDDGEDEADVGMDVDFDDADMV